MGKIKLKDGFLLRQIAGENVVVPVDEGREIRHWLSLTLRVSTTV